MSIYYQIIKTLDQSIKVMLLAVYSQGCEKTKIADCKIKKFGMAARSEPWLNRNSIQKHKNWTPELDK